MDCSADSSHFSTSIGEAQASVGQLEVLIMQILQSNQEMSLRLARMEMQAGQSLSRASQSLSDIDESKDDESCTTIKPASKSSQEETFRERADSPRFGFAFDEVLHTSRPYTRVMQRQSTWSPSSSAIQSVGGWSCLSGMSLADLSDISVIGLPISPKELWNSQHYIAKTLDHSSLHQPKKPNDLSATPRLTRNSPKDKSRSPMIVKKLLSYQNTMPRRRRSTGSNFRSMVIEQQPVLPAPKKLLLLGENLVHLDSFSTFNNHFWCCSKELHYLARLPYINTYKCYTETLSPRVTA